MILQQKLEHQMLLRNASKPTPDYVVAVCPRCNETGAILGPNGNCCEQKMRDERVATLTQFVNVLNL